MENRKPELQQEINLSEEHQKHIPTSFTINSKTGKIVRNLKTNPRKEQPDIDTEIIVDKQEEDLAQLTALKNNLEQHLKQATQRLFGCKNNS